MKTIREVRWTFLPVLLALSALAQGPVATVSGEVHDPSGASVSGAIITARKTDTNVVRTTISTDSGAYTIVGLTPGPYEVSTEAKGFSRQVHAGITLEVAQDARVDFQLQLGAANDVVNVTEQVPTVETESGSSGTVINNKKVVELPLNGRQFYSLALLVPGTNIPAQSSTNNFRGGFNVSGRAETNNNFTANGIDDNDQAVNAPQYVLLSMIFKNSKC